MMYMSMFVILYRGISIKIIFIENIFTLSCFCAFVSVPLFIQ